MNVKLDLPYPEIRIEGKNEYYADLLLQDYAGQVSETTAALLYSYQHFEKFNTNKEFAKIIEEISIVEMKHLEMLGKLIKLLGKNPMYITCETRGDDCTFWNAGYVNYETNLEKMLEIDIMSEQKAIRNYQIHKDMINDKYIKKILDRIILDEKRHLEIFNKLLSSLK